MNSHEPSDSACAPVEAYYKLECVEEGVNVRKTMTMSAGAALQSNTFRRVIAENVMQPATDASAPFPVENVDAATMKKIIEWCETHRAVEPSALLLRWEIDFFKSMDNKALFKLICACNYLDIERLMFCVCKFVAEMATNKTPEELRRLFAIPTDAEDEAAGRRGQSKI